MVLIVALMLPSSTPEYNETIRSAALSCWLSRRQAFPWAVMHNKNKPYHPANYNKPFSLVPNRMKRYQDNAILMVVTMSPSFAPGHNEEGHPMHFIGLAWEAQYLPVC